MHVIKIQKILLALAMLSAILAAPLRAQDDSAGVPVHIKVTAQPNGYGGELGSFSVASQVIASNDVPGGLLDLNATADTLGQTSIQDSRTVMLEVGRSYAFTVEASTVSNVRIMLQPASGYTAQVDGVSTTYKSIVNSAPPYNCVQILNIRVLSAANENIGRAGAASSIDSGKKQWQVALGSLKSGASAGVLTLMDLTAVYTPVGLNYEAPSTEVYVHRESGMIRQIIANEAVVDVVNFTSYYEIRFFNIQQMSGSVYPRALSGLPYVTYVVAQDGGASKVKITSKTRKITGLSDTEATAPVVRTAVTTLERSGVAPICTWTMEDWHTDGSIVKVSEKRTNSGSVSARAEAIEVMDPTNRDALNNIIASTKINQTHAQYNWGEAVGSVTQGTGLANAKISNYTYYTNSGVKGSYGAVEKVYSSTGGEWVGFEYDSAQFGVMVKRHRPFGGTPLPATITGNTAGEVTTFDYTEDAFYRKTRPTLVETKVDGKTTARATFAYVNTTANGMDIVQVTRSDQAGSGGAVLSTVVKYYREDTFDDFYRNQPYSIQNPDGTKVCYIKQRGSWTGVAFTAGATGNSSRELIIRGTTQSAGNVSLSSYDEYTVDLVYLVANKSTMEAVVRNAMAQVCRTETYVWSGSTWTKIAHVDYTYDWANQLEYRTDSNGNQHISNFNGELKQYERDASGVRIDYTYDFNGRIETATKVGAGGIGALCTKYIYDADNRIVSREVGYGQAETMTTSRVFDVAGRLVSESMPGYTTSGATPITTTYTYSYSATGSSVTIGLPNGGNRTETILPDGRETSLTGSAVVPEYYYYEILSDGVRYQERQVGTSDRQSTTRRVLKTWSDWLGRNNMSSRPGFKGITNFEEQYEYALGDGRLTKATRSGYGASFYEYNDLSQVKRKGLRVGVGNALVLGSSDRIEEADQSYIYELGNWWLVTEQKTYPKKDNAAAVVVRKVKQRLTGFSGTTRAETIEIDANNNTVTTVTAVDTSTSTTTITTTASGHSGSAVRVLVGGLETSVTGFDSLTSTIGYDALHRVRTRSEPGKGTTTISYYPGTALVSTVADANNVIVATNYYDAAGRTIAVFDAGNAAIRTQYNARDQVTHRWGSGTHPVKFVYDDLTGEQTEMHTYQVESGWDGAYWPTGTIAPATVTKWVYDGPSGLLEKKYPNYTAVTDPYIEYEYNIRGQTSRRYWARKLSDNVTRLQTDYGYDGYTGELLTISYNDQAQARPTKNVTYTYTRMGQVATVDDDGGLRTYVYESTKALWLDGVQFDGFYNNRRLTQQYDSLLRPVGIKVGTSSNYTADLIQTHAYNGVGRFDGIDSARTGQATRHFGYGYNGNGKINSYTAGTQFSVSRVYADPRQSLLTSIDTKWGVVSLSRYDYQYNSRAQRQTALQSGTIWGDFGESTHRRYSYNNRGELDDAADYLGSNINASSNTEPQLSGRHHVYQYDAIGNRKAVSRLGINPDATDDYFPNALNQYSARENNMVHLAGTVANSSVTVGVSGGVSVSVIGRQGRYWNAQAALANNAGPAKATMTVTATYPGAGDNGADLVRTETRSAYLPMSYQVFTYDLDGNLTGDGIRSYSYDAENRLITVTTNSTAVAVGWPNIQVEFKYDNVGRRVQKRTLNAGSETCRRYMYDGWNLVAEFDATTSSCGAIKRSFTWGLDLADSLGATGGVGALLQIADHDANVDYYPSYDGNGNVAALLRASDGVAVAKYEYTPFGELIRAEGPYALANPFRFSTKYMDDETGLVYYGQRYYSPSLGRFINRDPIAEQGGINLYGFCGNDAINHWDYLGNSWLSSLWNKTIGKAGKWLGKNWTSVVGAALYFVPGVGPALSMAWNAGVGYYYGGVKGLALGFATSAIGAAIGGPIAGRVAGALNVTNRFALAAIQGAFRGGFAGGATALATGRSFSDGFLSGAVAGAVISTGMEAGMYATGRDPQFKPFDKQNSPGFAKEVGLSLKSSIERVIGEDWGKAWRSLFTEKWVDGPTGGKLPESLAKGLEDIRNQVPGNARENGMHAWHAGSNAYLASKFGLLGAPLIAAGGVFHETPFDWGSFKAEQRWQGTVNHVLDSTMDLVANVFGMGVGYLNPGKVGIAVNWGNRIPGPGDPDPLVGGRGTPYTGNPSDDWGPYR